MYATVANLDYVVLLDRKKSEEHLQSSNKA